MVIRGSVRNGWGFAGVVFVGWIEHLAFSIFVALGDKEVIEASHLIIQAISSLAVLSHLWAETPPRHKRPT